MEKNKKKQLTAAEKLLNEEFQIFYKTLEDTSKRTYLIYKNKFYD